MSKYLIEESTLTDLANSIRSKTGGVEEIEVRDMSDEIDSIRTYVAPTLSTVAITPTGEEIVLVPEAGTDGYGIISVSGDENLVSENIKSGVTVYGVAGNLEQLDTSDATATAIDLMLDATAYVNGEKITGTYVPPDEPVLSECYVMPTGTEFIETPDDGVTGFSSVTVLGDDNLSSRNIASGVTIYGVTGTLTTGGSGGGISGEPGESNLVVAEVTPTASSQTITPDTGCDGFSKVQVAGDPDLVPRNIVEGVNIFGVVGTAGSNNPVFGSLSIPNGDIIVSPTFIYGTVEEE